MFTGAKTVNHFLSLLSPSNFERGLEPLWIIIKLIAVHQNTLWHVNQGTKGVSLISFFPLLLPLSIKNTNGSYWYIHWYNLWTTPFTTAILLIQWTLFPLLSSPPTTDTQIHWSCTLCNYLRYNCCGLIQYHSTRRVAVKIGKTGSKSWKFYWTKVCRYCLRSDLLIQFQGYNHC